MADHSTSNNTQTATIGRIWYGVLAFLLLGLLMSPWADGMTPATNPLRFLSKLPFPAGNVLFACYLIIIYLNLRQCIYAEKDEQQTWYRFFLSLGAMGAILKIADLAVLELTWITVIVWILLCLATMLELRFLKTY
ncbi:MAG: hypothetical protein AB8G95_24900 [Anaerolineae bacterium]